MSVPTLTRRELLNVALFAFIPSGETVDAITVSPTTWPDNNPLSNWNSYKIPDIETLIKAREFETEIFDVPKSAGGYSKDESNSLIKVSMTMETAMTTSYFKQLEFGLAAPPVVGVAQAPYVANDNYIEGVALIEYQNKSGVVTEREQIWCRLRLDDPGPVGPKTRKTTFSIEKRDSGNNTYARVA